MKRRRRDCSPLQRLANVTTFLEKEADMVVHTMLFAHLRVNTGLAGFTDNPTICLLLVSGGFLSHSIGKGA